MWVAKDWKHLEKWNMLELENWEILKNLSCKCHPIRDGVCYLGSRSSNQSNVGQFGHDSRNNIEGIDMLAQENASGQNSSEWFDLSNCWRKLSCSWTTSKENGQPKQGIYWAKETACLLFAPKIKCCQFKQVPTKCRCFFCSHSSGTCTHCPRNIHSISQNISEISPKSWF